MSRYEGTKWLRREMLAPTIIFAIGVPCLIVVHELGHFVAAISLGYPARLSYAAVNFTMPRESYLGVEGLLITLGGPLVNLLLAVVGLFGLRRLSKIAAPSRIQWYVIWVLSVFVSGGGRGLLKIFSSSGSDEADVAEWFGFSGIAGPVIMMIPSLILLFYMLRFHYRKSSLSSLLLGWTAGLLGMILWLRLIGPAVLPAHKMDAGVAVQPAAAVVLKSE